MSKPWLFERRLIWLFKVSGTLVVLCWGVLSVKTAWAQESLAIKPLEPQFDVLPVPTQQHEPKMPAQKPTAVPSGVSGNKTLNARALDGKVSGKSASLPAKPANASQKPFQLRIAQSQYLPPEMYGQWTIYARLIESNAPDLFPPLTINIWLLEQSGDQVMLSNPQTGASAVIRVDSVVGNTATFHRRIEAIPGKVMLETPTLSVQGDHLSGQNLQEFVITKDGALKRRVFCRFAIEGQRLGQARLKVQPKSIAPGQDVEEQFEIEPLRSLD